MFEAARDFVVEGLDGAALACDHTRRNAPAVLAAVNARVRGGAARPASYDGFRAHTTEVDGSAGEPALLALPGVAAAAAGRPRCRRGATPSRSGATP